MLKQLMDIVHNNGNGYLDWLFHQNVFPLRKSNSIMSDNGKDSHLRSYLEVPSLSSGQVFGSIQLKTFSKFSGWTFNCFLLLNSIIVYFVYL